jgi:RHS repeat-associated protein
VAGATAKSKAATRSEKTFTMKVDLAVLDSLGINLYSNAAAVLSELVANAYDADSTLVEISWNDGGTQVVVADDGTGMSVKELNKRFLTVGYKKRSKEGSKSKKWNRPFMGRKGIGKLSVFSIAETVREDGTTRYDYDYDLDSNLTRADERGTVTTYAYNPVHEITEINGAAAGTYDANGNLQSLQGQTYSYDQRSRTRSIDPPGAAPAVSFDYADESQAERWMKTNSAGDTEFWDTMLGTSVEDPPTSGEDRIYYTRSPQGQVLSMMRDLNSRSGDYYPLTDQLGTTVALTNSSGGLVSRYRYEPYGQQIGTPSGTTIPWRFAGQYLDTETGLYKMGLRYYDPGTMRWTQKDPLNLFQDPKQGNRYSYAGSDPVNNVDPSGADYCTEQGVCFYQDSSYSGGATVPDPCAGLYDLHPECMRSYGSNAVSGFFSGLTGCLTGFLNPFGSCKGGAFLGPLLDPLLDPDPAY